MNKSTSYWSKRNNPDMCDMANILKFAPRMKSDWEVEKKKEKKDSHFKRCWNPNSIDMIKST